MFDLSEVCEKWVTSDNLKIAGAALAPLGTLAAGYFIGKWKESSKQVKQKAAIETGEMDGDDAIMGHTRYMPMATNGENGLEVFYQKIRNQEARLNLRDIFHDSVRDRIMGFLKAAKEKCTPENPLVFAHLHEVVPDSEWKKVRELIATQWLTAFSGVLTDTPMVVRQQLNMGPREEAVEKMVYPVLVYEPGAEKKQERVLLIYPDENGKPVLPLKEQVNFTWPTHGDRHDTNAAIIKSMDDPFSSWIWERTGVGVPTGEVRVIPEPPVLTDKVI